MGYPEWAQYKVPYKTSQTITGYLIEDIGYCPDCWPEIEGDVDVVFENDASPVMIKCCVCGKPILREGVM